MYGTRPSKVSKSSGKSCVALKRVYQSSGKFSNSGNNYLFHYQDFDIALRASIVANVPWLRLQAQRARQLRIFKNQPFLLDPQKFPRLKMPVHANFAIRRLSSGLTELTQAGQSS